MLVEVLSPDDDGMRVEIKRLKAEIRTLEVERNKIMRACGRRGHVVIKKTAPDMAKGKQKGGWYNPADNWGSAHCAVCSEDLGWYCPDSPTGLCEYDDKEDLMHDTCLHCGAPEERR
jgi:hypothetical protein